MQEERVLALESLRATAEDLLPYDPADIYASTPTPILPHLLLLLYGKAGIYIYIYTSENTAAKKDFQWCHIQTSPYYRTLFAPEKRVLSLMGIN
jgi:hypothetical protein